METIQIIDKEKEEAIKEEARLYANSVISTGEIDNWTQIYNLKREVLSMTEGQSQINLDMMKREKKREKQHQEEVEKLNKEIAELKEVIQRKSKPN